MTCLVAPGRLCCLGCGQLTDCDFYCDWGCLAGASFQGKCWCLIALSSLTTGQCFSWETFDLISPFFLPVSGFRQRDVCTTRWPLWSSNLPFLGLVGAFFEWQAVQSCSLGHPTCPVECSIYSFVRNSVEPCFPYFFYFEIFNYKQMYTSPLK